jgi:ribosomal-protein-alanine N-acetyltransferase
MQMTDKNQDVAGSSASIKSQASAESQSSIRDQTLAKNQTSIGQALAIRPMQEKDLLQVSTIEAQNFSDPWTIENYHYYLERENAIFLVASEEENILGYIGLILAADEGDITNVSVAPKAKGHGIGTKLLQVLLNQADKRGVQKIFLEVRKSNTVASRLYQQAGFRKIGIRKNYYSDPAEDADLMCRNGRIGYP